MKFTFGIITTGSPNITKIVDSIEKQKIENYEVIIVGGDLPTNISNNVPIKHIEFDETTKKAWITKKKNLITENAKYENIVYLHDYFIFEEYWYYGFQLFGNNWDICMNIIINKDGVRYRDWCIYSDPNHCYPSVGPHKHKAFIVPYSYDNTQYMYISGGYWIAKKKVMEENPLNEKLSWGEGEDVEWSSKVLPKYKYKINTLSTVSMLKQKPLELTYLEI